MATWLNRQRIGLFTAVVYFLLAGFAMAMNRHGGLSAMSPATPFLLAMLIGRARRQWGPILIGAAIGSVAASSIFGFGAFLALPMAAARVGEVGVAAWLFNRLRVRRGFLGSLERVGRFVAAVGIAGPALGGTIAAATVAIAYDLPFDRQWRLWFVGHSLSMISLTPVISLVLSGAVRRWWRDAPHPLRLEGALLVGATTVVAVGVFGQDRVPLLFLPILPLMLTTFRLGLIGAGASSIVLALVGGYATLHEMGPANFLGGDMQSRMEFLQLYLACTVLTAFPVAADLSRRQALYRRLGESEARYRLLADHSTDIMMGIDAEGRIKYLSPSFEQITGRDPADFTGRQAFELVHPLDRTAVTAAHRDAIADPGGMQIVEYRAQMNDGAQRWFESHIRAVLDGDGMVSGTVSMIRDVSHRKSREAELSRAASTDPLTGLANRRAFDAALADRIAAPGPGTLAGCVAVFDIDHFKTVNDRFGHDAGDKVLQAFARMARGVMREGDVVARLGGEEFGILFPDTGIDHAHALCERLRTTLAATRLRQGPSIVELTVSAGIAAIDGSDSATAVLRAADRALYAAKAEGRDRLRRAA
ncbi:diguanylate cyclase [Sphingomonas sp. 2R-10]|uniref:sensor domain-containing diguanylate cyclase n=1 Tax=Sphingomonas sp. 2R-10 TaxID=3045148 RepID=UPI000F7A02F2|nr:sensor domain-containing diguanylate cyclase [Sphingomonas sp. 2R-10]MDJ0277215.1 diguanylate cyclase [Sphingomonas sp. 2R-10]